MAIRNCNFIAKLLAATLILNLLGFIVLICFGDKSLVDNVRYFINPRHSDRADGDCNHANLSVALSQERSINNPKTDVLTNVTLIQKRKWDLLQEQRRIYLKHACMKLADKPPFNITTNITNVIRTNKQGLWPFIVNDAHKLLYCFISKVGSGNWKAAFLVLMGKYKRVEDIPSYRAHDPSLRKLNSYNTPEDISQRLDNYTTFIFVRNPFARVISAYREKLEENNKSYQESVGRYIVKRYRENPTAEELQGQNVTLPEFVKFLTDYPQTKVSDMDGHWRPMYQMVLPCSVRFDYIGKLESAMEDAKYILQDTHVDHLIHYRQTQRNVSHDQATFDRYFSDVPREDVKKLYEIYYPDFLLFGYELPDYMKSWVRRLLCRGRREAFVYSGSDNL